jgi:hypothetical protein
MLVVLPALLFVAGEARAHKLEVKCKVLPDRQVQVSARYRVIPRSIPAQDAEVRVFRRDGTTLVEGKTDDHGLFVFSWEDEEPLRVEVYQEGHVGKARVGSGPEPEEESDWTQQIKDVLIGIALLLALAALGLGLRNARQLRELKKHQPPPP